MSRVIIADQRVLGFFLVFVLCCWMAACGQAMARPSEIVEIPASPNPVGSGARALGMGGAFIAVADDATAASWNPGGLIQLERPEISVVGAGFDRAEDLRFGLLRGASGGQSVRDAGLNYLSATYPFSRLGRNMIVSLSYQHLYDFSREWRFRARNEGSDVERQNRQEGALYAWGAAYCAQILPELSLGLTLNFWEDGLFGNGWEQTSIQRGKTFGVGRFKAVRKDQYTFSGFNANVGILWSATDKLSIGAVFKSPFTADLKHSNKAWTRQGGRSWSLRRFENDEELDMPMSYGLGAAYRFSDLLTISADVYRTHWESFLLTFQDGTSVSPVSGLPEKESSVGSTTQVRFGAEFLILKAKYVIPLRAGFFYDPSPAEGSPDAHYGLTAGTGIGLDRFAIDIAYQYRFGTEVGSSILRRLEFSEDVRQHMIYTSLIVYF